LAPKAIYSLFLNVLDLKSNFLAISIKQKNCLYMKLRIACLTLVVASLGQADVTINTTALGGADFAPFGYVGETPGNGIDDNQNGQIDELGFVSRHHIVGQTFELLPGFSVVESIKARTRDIKFGDERDRDTDFKCFIMAWDVATNRPTGSVIFQTETLTTVQNGSEQEYEVQTDGLLLKSGERYVLFLMLDDPELSSSNHSNCSVAIRSGNPYSGGSLVTKTNGTLGLAGIEAETWSSSPNHDLSFVVNAGPVPAGFSAAGNEGSITQVPFGTHGDIPANTVDDNQNGSVDEDFVSPLHRHTMGQTFLVPAGVGTLDAVTFTFLDSVFSGLIPEMDKAAAVILSVAEWNPSTLRPTGPVLYQSDLTDVPEAGLASSLVFGSLNIPVTTGKNYIANVSVEDLGLTLGNHSLCHLLVRSDNPYTAGSAYQIGDDTRNFLTLEESPWTPVAGDLVGGVSFLPVDTTVDSNGDSVPDAWVAAYGLDPARDYSALSDVLRAVAVAEVQETPEDFGLYDATSIQDLRFGGVLIEKTGGGVTLDLTIETSGNMLDWDDFETITRTIPLLQDKAFLRVRGEKSD
jgi:hypothetical protein